MAKRLFAVTHTISPADDDGEGLHQIRVLVRQANMIDLANTQTLQAEAWAWLEDETGITPATFDDSDITTDAAKTFTIAHETRSILMSTVERWEERNGSGEWETIPMPADWATIEGFVHEIPQAFVLFWRNAANRANPNLWEVNMTPAEKKRGAVTVTELMMS